MKRLTLLALAFLLTACSLSSSTTKEPTPAAGADRDAHGCIPSAGYTWCEPKQKCLRAWEEACFSSAFEAIAWELAQRHGDTQDKISLTMEKQTETHARASVRFGPKGSPGGIVLAANKDNSWRIVYEGNGSVDCPALKADAFPQEMLVGICD
ncbi:MAG: hypothetical protein PHO20_01905 [Candidatus Peribacteraceae bacterium]|nr:hypothetical protein [Candidatus Peribacteraceae bacterium]MDD5739498.1 hypothetical protein [Candidatus Peribacteraceae bacterium]